MPLILAIESDRRQASQLSAMVRQRLRAELVIADAAEPALAALGDRVPDLILTSALLSTKDEAVLAERLRLLDAAAAHVQTLTIPMLDTPQPRPAAQGRGVLSALLGDRSSSAAAPDGCDPAVFAEQCREYLERAAVERVQAAPAVPHSEPAPVVQPAPPRVVESAPAIVAAPPAPAIVAASPAPTPVAAPSAPAPVEEPIEESVEIDLSAMFDESVVRQLSAAIETVARDGMSAAPPSPRDATSAAPPSPRDATSVPPAPHLRPRPPRPSSPSPSASVQAAVPRLKRFPERKPIQDEWGFFDPAQCGFAALLAKLDEITHMAPSLPPDAPSAGPPAANR
jgi:hypothetical protein